MTKRKASFNPQQLGFTFEAPETLTADASLAGLDRVVASAVGQILKEDPRSRYEVAAGVSAMLDEDVSKAMLDAYAAEAKDGHNISLARFLTLIAETQRYDVLDALCHRIGCKILVGEEVLTAELGHVQAQMERLQARLGVLKKVAPTIQQGDRRK